MREKYEPRHGDRVMRGSLRGVVLKCQGKKGPYFKVKWDSGTWDWPDLVEAESSGAYIGICGECSIEYRTIVPNARSGWCPNCLRRQDADEQAKTTQAGPSHQFGRRGGKR